MDIKLDDPEATPEMRALQIQYQDAITRALLEQMKEITPNSALCMVNALGHHLSIAVRALRRSDALAAGAVERMLKRLEIALREP